MLSGEQTYTHMYTDCNKLYKYQPNFWPWGFFDLAVVTILSTTSAPYPYNNIHTSAILHLWTQSLYSYKYSSMLKAKSWSCFTFTWLIFSVLSCQVSNLQQQSFFFCYECPARFSEGFKVGKLLYDWWRIWTSAEPQFPSPPCRFCQKKSFYTCFLVRYSPRPSSTT